MLCMSHRYWPVLDIRLRVDDLVLRPFTDADAERVARILPLDVELNPESATYVGAAPGTARGTVVQQDYWRAMGTWTADQWRLNFGVWRDDEMLGAQELEARDFATLRTVDSASFLVVAARGLGIGKAMRRAVLTLAFGPLAAQRAVTSAWHDNHASLGVSRALGYVDNGVERHRREDAPGGVDDLVHLRLERDAWLSSGLADGVTVEGVDQVGPYFGLT